MKLLIISMCVLLCACTPVHEYKCINGNVITRVNYFSFDTPTGVWLKTDFKCEEIKNDNN